MTKPRTNSIDYNLFRITLAERLFLWRHRQPATDGRLMGSTGSAMSQPEAAAALGLDQGLYHRIENGAKPHIAQRCVECGSVIAIEDRRALAGVIRVAEGVDPTPAELCHVARRRSGLTLSEVCAELGITRPTFHAWERTADPRLVARWVERGFSFPE